MVHGDDDDGRPSSSPRDDDDDDDDYYYDDDDEQASSPPAPRPASAAHPGAHQRVSRLDDAHGAGGRCGRFLAHSASAISAPLPHGRCGDPCPRLLRAVAAPRYPRGGGAPGTVAAASGATGQVWVPVVMCRDVKSRILCHVAKVKPRPSFHLGFTLASPWLHLISAGMLRACLPAGAQRHRQGGAPARAARGGPEQLVARTSTSHVWKRGSLWQRLRDITLSGVSFGIEAANTADVPSSAALRCAALCRAVLRGAQLCSAGLRCPGLRSAALWHVLPHCALRRSAMPSTMSDFHGR
eukprot:gene17685-biopygen401